MKTGNAHFYFTFVLLVLEITINYNHLSQRLPLVTAVISLTQDLCLDLVLDCDFFYFEENK